MNIALEKSQIGGNMTFSTYSSFYILGHYLFEKLWALVEKPES